MTFQANLTSKLGAVRQALNLVRMRGNTGAAFSATPAKKMQAVGVTTTPAVGTLGQDGVTRTDALWLAAYVESTASTPAAVDGPVGFLSDGCSSVTGPELVLNPGGPYTATTSWSDENSNLTTPGGKLRVTSIGNSYGIARQIVTVQAGKTYKVTFKGRAVLGVGWFIVGESGAQQENLLVQGLSSTETEYTVSIKATTNEFWFKWQTDNVIANSYTEAASTSCKASTASRHATQNSGPNKPTMRRGLVNLLLNSNNPNAGNWVRVGCTATQNGAGPFTGSVAYDVSYSGGVNSYLVSSTYTGPQNAGTPFTIAVPIRSGGSAKRFLLRMMNGVWTDWVNRDIECTGEWQIFTVSGSFPEVNDWVNLVIDPLDEADAAIYQIGPVGLFYGVLSAEDIEACGGIPLTTTIAASGTGGNYALEFDGAAKSLVLPSPAFQAADDQLVIVGFWPSSIPGSTGGVFSPASNSSTYSKQACIDWTSAGQIAAHWTSDAPADFVAAYTSPVGMPVVATARKKGTTGYLRVNGVDRASVSLAGMGASTLNAGFMGLEGNGSNFFKGLVFGGLAFRGSFTDAEVLAMERGIAAGCPIPNLLRF